MKLDFLKEFDFFTGVPDSLLRPLCDWIMDRYGISKEHHIVAANEGNATALAAGYYLSTGKIPVVYMQNSGIGNIINPVASLLNDKVYAIPVLFIVGWRGEPGVHDEPQHIYQGEVTLSMLENADIKTFVVTKTTSEQELSEYLSEAKKLFAIGKSAALVIKKGALEFERKISYKNDIEMQREDILRHIAHVSGEDIVVSTTGKASRELFEIREAAGQGHKYDFLTVGSMGHSSSIALAIALQKPDRKIWCIDGDGAVLMHMGAMALMGANAPANLVHIVINNSAHETVGGIPTVADSIDLVKVAEGCGYKTCVKAESFEQLDEALETAKVADKLTFIEVKCAIGSRADLGRPTTTPQQNKESFMNYLAEENR